MVEAGEGTFSPCPGLTFSLSVIRYDDGYGVERKVHLIVNGITIEDWWDDHWGIVLGGCSARDLFLAGKRMKSRIKYLFHSFAFQTHKGGNHGHVHHSCVR
jgi:hypothetical protein